MRFSETLRFNANPDWWVYYVPYEELKQLVTELRQLRRAVFLSSATSTNVHNVDDSTDEEADARVPITKPLQRSASHRVLSRLHGESVRASGYSAVLKGVATKNSESGRSGVADLTERFERKDKLFFEKLEKIKSLVDDFYAKLSLELGKVTEELEEEADKFMSTTEGKNARTDLENMPLLANEGHVQGTEEDFAALRSKVLDHYRELGDTVDYSNLNRTAFDKILKKHDKYTDRNTRAVFMANLTSQCAFVDTTELEDLQLRVETTYSRLYRGGDTRRGREELRGALRDLIVWDRNTIWREALRKERKVSAFHKVKGGPGLDITEDGGKVEFRPKLIPVAISLIASVLVMLFPQVVRSLVVEGGTEYSAETLGAAHRCLAVTACVVVLWASEGLPLYVTSFLVIPLMVLGRVFLNTEGAPSPPDAASAAAFNALSSPTLVLIICVYVLGAALSKYELDKFVANVILARFRKPHRLLIAVMFLAVLVSMLVSNVAAPVLLTSVMMPTMDAMGQSKNNRKYVRCLLLGIMAASNVGGFVSPISSPQSAVALGLLTGDNIISFQTWVLIAIPQCAVMVVCFYLALLILYQPHRYVLPPLPQFSEKFSWPHWVVIVTLFVTVAIWSFHGLQDLFGSAGIVAVIPILVFFGSGILKKEDFNNLPWDVVYLVAGGSVLGAAVESSKLLDLVAEKLTSTIGTDNVYRVYLVFCLFLTFVANGVSHTVSAIIVLPLMYRIGETIGHGKLLVLAGTFAASCAMALPISSFPNISATQVEDESGEPYLTSREVLLVGSLMTMLALIVLLSFGYFLMAWFFKL